MAKKRKDWVDDGTGKLVYKEVEPAEPSHPEDHPIGCRCCVECLGWLRWGMFRTDKEIEEERKYMRWVRRTNHNTGEPL